MKKIIDLTITNEEGMTTFPVYWHPFVEVTQMGRIGIEGRETKKIIIGTHTGTNLDAPRHFIENGITIDGRTLAYDAIKNKNGKIVGFVDNTEAGEGKRYVVNETYQGTNDVLLTDHKNFNTTEKWFNFAKNADQNPSKVITSPFATNCSDALEISIFTVVLSN